MKSVLVLLLCALFICSVTSDGKPEKHWALLVAGSNNYFNYRHQADVCHAYHVIRKHGIPDERIVVMMYDDIAHHPENPVQGNIINEPNGPNLYPGVLKDYTKTEVSPEVFLKVLTGDENGIHNILGRPGKVIKSGPNDHVFVNFVDHGAPGMLGFPYGLLHAKDLNKAILKMHRNKQYKKMVFYVEACESGSMFNKIIRDDINVFVTTAANPDQSSSACYFDDWRVTYLGDVYSVNWMHDSEIENLRHESLQQQYKIVRKETNTSEVMDYGDLSMKKDKVGDFQGNISNSDVLVFRSEKKHNPNIGAVPSEDVQLEILRHKAQVAEGDEKRHHEAAIKTLLEERRETREFFQSIVQSSSNINYDAILKRKIEFSYFDCYVTAVTLVKDLCPGLNLVQNDFALRNLRSLANLCEMKVRKEAIWAIIKRMTVRNSICKV